jgi:hypothetical protein
MATNGLDHPGEFLGKLHRRWICLREATLQIILMLWKDGQLHR